ncbi:MAG: carbamoyltransferase HypF [bacterium]|nr:carbamoyltransferase HypF [bacterium]
MKGILDRSIAVFQKAPVRARIRVHGIVQGVGFRPFVWRKATQMGLFGTVCNEGSFVEIIVQGEAHIIHAFEQALRNEKPARAGIADMEAEYEELLSADEQTRYTDFQIIPGANSEGNIFVSPDIAICPQCETELFDKTNRRYLHPFINCTACGPRLTIMERLPYDRERTVMKNFAMCAECEEEYYNPSSRRFDAQPVCCPSCGPRVYIPGENLWDEKAIIRARWVIREGGIVAVKGIGGFHLCCDARNEQAVELLRERKKRPRKPFALMAKNINVVKKLCNIHPIEENLLTGEKKPIVLCEKKAAVEKEYLLAEAIAPGNPTLGMMLPYAPLQWLLFDYPDGQQMTDVLVMTSANRAGAPICRTEEEVAKQLSDVCDLILSHDREILLRADDSIMEYIDGVPSMFRRSRGYAPLPVQVSVDWSNQVLAIGGELKNSFVIGKGALFYSSPYVGDLTDARSIAALRSALARMQELLEANPQVVVCDMHPNYQTVAFAKTLGLPVLQVQHHYAHILSCLAENDALSLQTPVIGVAFDGTGYGCDGTIWGGEFLLSDIEGFERIGSIAPFLQPGADASAREGFRIAAALLLASYEEKVAGELVREFEICGDDQWEVLAAMCRTGINCATSTSMGRLFDGVSALLGVCNRSTYEGEAAMELQFLAEQLTDEQSSQLNKLWEEKKAKRFWVDDTDDGTFHLQYIEMLQSLVELRREGVSTAVLARLFHEALADAVVKACMWIREKRELTTVAVSGGCFQNRLLLSLVRSGLQKEGFEVLSHAFISPNDGGIALGQAVYGMHQLEKNGGNL